MYLPTWVIAFASLTFGLLLAALTASVAAGAVLLKKYRAATSPDRVRR